MHEHDLGFRLNLDRFDQLTKERGWTTDQQRSAGLGISHTTLGRIRRGHTRPGARFIAAATGALKTSVEDLFTASEAR